MNTTDIRVIDLQEGEYVSSTPAWTALETSGGKAYIVRRLMGAERCTLAPTIRPTDGPDLDAVARARGRRVVNFDPYQREATLAELPAEVARVRDLIARHLKTDPWAVDVSVLRDEDGGRTVLVWESPAITGDPQHRRERWLEIARSLYQEDDDSLWRVQETWVAGERRTLLVYSRDPLADTHTYPTEIAPTMDAIPFAIDERGGVLTYPVRENSWLLGGLPGGGKSGGQTALLAGMAQLDHTAIIGIDAKRVELKPWEPRLSALGVDMQEIDDILTRTVGEMLRRYKWLEQKGLKKVKPGPETPQICVVIDELAELVGTGLKENKASEERIASNVRRLMSLGRAAGITVQLATQKPSSDIVPTALRDQVVSRVAYACATDAQVDTILGAGACRGGARADKIPRNRRGVCYAQSEDSRTARRVRTFWIPDDEVEALAVKTAHLRVPLPWLEADVDADEVDEAADLLGDLLGD